MDNTVVEKEICLKRNWKWSVPATLVFIFIIALLFRTNSPEHLTTIVLAYNDTSLYEKAIEKANSSKRVLQTIGTIQPIDKLAILEGNIAYSNSHNSVELSVRIKGNKGTGKLDLVAEKIGTEWKYKNAKKEIVVVNEF